MFVSVYQILVDKFDDYLRECVKKDIEYYENFPKKWRKPNQILGFPKDLLDRFPEKPVLQAGRVGLFKRYKMSGKDLIFGKRQFRKKNLSKTILGGVSYYYNTNLKGDEKFMLGDYLPDYLCKLLDKSFYEIYVHYVKGF